MASAGDADAQRRVGADLAVEMALAVRDRVQGWQLAVPFGRVEAAERFLAGLRAAVPEAGATPAAAAAAAAKNGGAS
jgi:hypothetical protein